MDAKHEQDRRQLAASFDAVTHDRSQFYRARIDFLKSVTYPESRPLIYTSYNPDTQVLLAKIGDEAYSFYHVAPANAESLFKNWKRVRAMQPWTEDSYHTRILTLASPALTAAGVSMGALQAKKVQDEQKKIEAKLAEAQAALDRRDYAGALSQFQAILELNPQQQAARNGIQAAQEGLQKRKEEEKNELAQGIWTDPDTGLMWTIRGDDYNVYWKRAEHFCQTLSRAGHADWRLPTIGELESLYDSNPDHERTFRWNLEHYHYRMKAEITLTRTIVWSGTFEQAGSKKAWVIDFSDGSKTVSDSFTGFGYEALCVRRPAP